MLNSLVLHPQVDYCTPGVLGVCDSVAFLHRVGFPFLWCGLSLRGTISGYVGSAYLLFLYVLYVWIFGFVFSLFQVLGHFHDFLVLNFVRDCWIYVRFVFGSYRFTCG